MSPRSKFDAIVKNLTHTQYKELLKLANLKYSKNTNPKILVESLLNFFTSNGSSSVGSPPPQFCLIRRCGKSDHFLHSDSKCEK